MVYSEYTKTLIEELKNPYYKMGFDILYPPQPKSQQGKIVETVRDSSINPKIGRNHPCPCGSTEKYKHCCYGKNN